MAYLGLALALFCAFEHVGFLVLEMFLWTGPIGKKVFALKPEFAAESKGLAMNQGLYNGFLAAGIVVGIFWAQPFLVTFSLACIVVAGVFGGITVKKSILFVQAVPAIAALVVRALA